VTLDEGDNDLVVLWSHVIEALGRVCPGLADKALLAMVPVAPVLEVVLPRLVNELVERGEVALVLDDFHRLSGGPARDSVAWFVDHVPASFQLILSSRADPALPLAALRAHGQLLELRADGLRFTCDETTEFLNGRLGLELDPADIGLLVARTEGWPAGLYLAALSLAGKADKHALVRTFDGTSTHVVDFLAGEVLAGYEPELQTFMLRTSVLERLCAELCDAVLVEGTSAAALESLARSNLFLVPLDARQRWFRFHHLFAQILRVELERREPGLAAELHRRAYAWHRASGTTDEAIHHALAARLFAEAGQLIAESWVHYANAGRTTSVLDWLTRFPEEVLAADARLLLVRAWVVALRGREDEMRSAVARVRVLGGLDDGPLPDGMASLESSLSVLSATFAWGDVGAVLEHGTRSAALEGPDSPWYPVLTWALGWAHYCNDELDLAEQRLKETVALGPRAEQWIVTVAAIADLSLIAGMRGRRAEQLRLADEAAGLARERGLLDSVEVGEVHTARGVALAAPRAPGGGAARARAGRAAAPVVGAAARRRRRAGRARPGHRRDRRPGARGRAARRGGGDPGRLPRPGRASRPARRGKADGRGRRRTDRGALHRSRAHRAAPAERRELGARDRAGAVRLLQHGAQPREVDLSQARSLLARRGARTGARGTAALTARDHLGESAPRW
jgi:LuxR family maltose regulon positive regulatory protein